MGLHLYRSKLHNICTKNFAVYFMYNSRVFKADPVNKLEKPVSEKSQGSFEILIVLAT